MPLLRFFAVVLYVNLCALVLVYVTAPLSLLAIVAGVVSGVASTVTCTLLVLSGRSGRERLTGPDDAAAGAVGRGGRDHAWPTYFANQVRHDLTAALAWSGQLSTTPWHRLIPVLARRKRVSAACWPLLIPVAVFLTAGFVGVFAGSVLVCAVVGAVTLAAWLVGLAVAGVLRSVDAAWRGILHTAPTCPHAGCNLVSPRPYFLCPGESCSDVHRDLRPGRLGILWRRCGCGAQLPTTVLRSGRLQAICPRCLRSLHPGAGIATDVSVPVFGAPMVGKSRFLMAAVVSLFELGDGSARLSLLDTVGEQSLTGFRAALHADGGGVTKTPVRPPTAITVGIAGPRRKALVHVFDAAGEHFVDRHQNERLGYLEDARALAFVLDPFSIPRVRDELAAHPELLADTAEDHLLESYRVTVQRLRDCGVDTRRQRLAFVVSKADRLAVAPNTLRPEPGSASVREWLIGVGLDGLVREAGHDFGTVRFFLTSSLHPDTQHPSAPLVVLRWLLAEQGVPLDRWVAR